MRILTAEDDPTSRVMLTALLEKCGHEVIETRNGMEALEELEREDAPKLVILDWMMPGLSGIEVCRRIRELATTQPPYIIMLTTLGDVHYLCQALNAGADDYLTKPFQTEELWARVRVGVRTLQLHERHDEAIRRLHEALEHVKTLRGIVPICVNCKRIRDDQGYWNQVEVYVRDHSEAEFSHGLCPQCEVELYPDLQDPQDPRQE